MASEPTPSFSPTNNAANEVKLSQESHLKNSLSQIFAGTRLLNENDIKHWVARDLFITAIKAWMLQPDINAWQLSDSEKMMLKMLVECKTGTLRFLRELDSQNPESVLEKPLLYQIFVVTALYQGNRGLVKEMISAPPPVVKHPLLLLRNEDRSYQTLSFGERRAFSHESSEGQPDNACGIWAALIRSGWAEPRGHMLTWAASSPDLGAGIDLLNTLIEKGIKIDLFAVKCALWCGHHAMLEYILTLYLPEISNPLSRSISSEESHELLIIAAKNKKGGAKQLQILWDRGVNDVDWMPESRRNAKVNPIALTEMLRNGDSPCQAPIHVAAMAGNAEIVEWLILKGAKPTVDYYGFNACETAKRWGQDEVVAIFERYRWVEVDSDREAVGRSEGIWRRLSRVFKKSK